MRRILLCIVSVLLCMPLFAQDNPVVMTVGGYDVTQSEFEYFFWKNNPDSVVSKKVINQYADMYLNYKLKVLAAIDEGLDQTESFLSEYQMCREMQAEDYIMDKDFLEMVARSTFEESQAQVGDLGLAHLFVMSSFPDENAGETLEDSYKLMQSIYARLKAGESFQSLARQYSPDALAENGGEAGWVSRNQLPDEITEIVFSLKDNEFSKPFVSDGICFIVMVDGHRQLGSYEENKHDIYNWLVESGAYDEAKRRKANEYAENLGWTERDDEAVARLDSLLDEVEPEFGNLAREYHDGLLVFDISNREIWERVSNHPEELESYYQSHTKQFKFDKPCFRGMVLFCRSENDYNYIKPILERTDRSEWVDSILAYNGTDVKIRVLRGDLETGLFHQGQNEYVDKIVFGNGDFKPMAGYPYVNVVGKVVKKPEQIMDVAGDVADQYQKYLENEWLKRLKSKYKYKINKKALKKVCQVK